MSVEIKLNQEENSYKTMPEVLADAKAGDTISITMQDNDILTGGNNNNGAGTALNYNITGGTISGNIADRGGFVQLEAQGSFTADGVLFSQNRSTNGTKWNGGGAISGGPTDSNKNGTVLTVKNSIFTSNISSTNGGAVNSMGTGSFTNVTFTKNSATENGGAFLHRGNNFSLENITVNGNSAGQRGGAFYMMMGNSTISSVDSRNTFADNFAKIAGGAIYYNGDTHTVAKTDFTGNTAAAVHASWPGGGAIYSNGTLTVTDCTFVKNISEVNGGAIYNAKTLTLNNVSFSGNTAKTSGGAIYNASTLNVSGGVSFSTDTDTIYNTGTVNFSNTNTINASIFSTGTINVQNNATLIFGNTSSVEVAAWTLGSGNTLKFNGKDVTFGTALDLSAVTIVVDSGIYSGTDTVVAKNVTGSLGDDDLIQGKQPSTYLVLDGSNLILKQNGVYVSRLDAENTLLGSYGSIYSALQEVKSGNETIKVEMTPNQIISGSFDGNGAEIAVNYDISGGTVSNNTAVRGGFVGLNQNQSFTAKGVLFTYNKSIGAKDWNGGGVISGGTSSNNSLGSVINVNDSIFDNNYSDSNGGAVVGRGTGSFCNVQFTNNRAKANGGALLNRGSNMIFENITVSGNSAGERGGAFYIQMGNSTIKATDDKRNCFANNYSALSAGAIFYNQDIQTLSDTDFSGNTSATTKENFQGGGAIYNAADLTVSDSNFVKNTSFLYGGAIYNAKTLTLNNVSFSENTAKTSGGAIYNAKTLTLNNVSFSGNTAKTLGGAIYNASTLNVSGGVSFSTDTDTIYNTGIVNFSNTNTVNASIDGSDAAVFNILENAVLTFNNTVEINIAALTIEVADSNTINLNGEMVNFTGLDASKVTITVDGTGLEAGDVIATGVTGTIDDDTVANVEKGYLDIVDGNLVLKVKTEKDGVLEENSTGTVFGGGAEANDGTDIIQTIASGEKAGTVYAGSQSGRDGVITTEVTGGKINKNLYGGGKVSADTTKLTISGGEIGQDVFGGISSSETKGELTEANLTISGGTFKHYVVGGSRVNAADGTTTHTTDIANLTISGGEFAGHFSDTDAGAAIFGAGYLNGTGSEAANVQYQVVESNVVISTDIAGAVYGGAFASKSGYAAVDTANVTVVSGNIDRVLGGGWAQTDGVSKVGDVNISIDGGKVGFVYAGGGNAVDSVSEVTGDVVISINDGSADYVFLGGRYINSSIAGSVELYLSGDAKEMIRISGYNGCGVDKTAGETQVFIDTDVTLDYLDYVDRLVIGENNKLTVNELLLVDPEQNMVLELNLGENGVLDMPESGDWVIMSGDALAGAYEQIEFRIGDDTFALGQQYGETGNGFKWEDNSLKFGKLA